jgi:hypothetical protein
MKFWYLFLAFLVLGPSLGAHNEMRLTPTIPMEMFEDQCNLPAPANLAVTNVGATDLSFSWDGVVGAYAYKVELTKVSTNTVVYSYTGLPQSYTSTISSLEPGTEYRFDIWSMCSATETGGLSSISETTHNFIIDELLTNYNGTQLIPGNPFPLFPIQSNVVRPLQFKIKNKEFESKFGVNNQIQAINGGVHVKHHNGGSNIQFVNHQYDNAQDAGGSIPSDNPGYVLLKNATTTNPVLEYRIIAQNGWYYLDWSQLNNSGFSILQISNPVGMGVVNNPNNTLQNQEEIDGVEERTESISTDTPCSIRPNPFTDLLTVQGSTPANVQLLDINGKLIYQYSMDTTETQTTIPTADLAKGVYLVRYETADSVKTIKVVKTN